MTSQVAVLSLYGAAVASDTVVTVHREGNTKVIPNSSKIIELGPEHKVLILNSGNVNLNNFPHDLHVHEWAKTLPGPLSTLNEYVRSYKAWSASERRLSTPESQADLLDNLVMSELAEAGDEVVRGRSLSLAYDEKSPSPRAHDKVDRRTIQSALDWLRGYKDFPELSRQKLREQLKSAGIDIEKRAAAYFSDIEPRISPSNLHLISELVWEAIGKAQARDSDSELGFIGMGSEQSFVGSVKLRCTGVFGGGLHAIETLADIDPGATTGRIVWFAQSDGIRATISGIHPEMRDEAREIVLEILQENLQLPFSKSLELGELFLEKVDAVSQRNFIDPMFSTISAYSISELSAFADTLVGSQANSNIFDDKQSTVGGLIEVASIDSRNGVLWHRRLPHSKLRQSDDLSII